METDDAQTSHVLGCSGCDCLRGRLADIGTGLEWRRIQGLSQFASSGILALSFRICPAVNNTGVGTTATFSVDPTRVIV
jgi:hypothetical protein